MWIIECANDLWKIGMHIHICIWLNDINVYQMRLFVCYCCHRCCRSRCVLNICHGQRNIIIFTMLNSWIKQFAFLILMNFKACFLLITRFDGFVFSSKWKKRINTLNNDKQIQFARTYHRVFNQTAQHSGMSKLKWRRCLLPQWIKKNGANSFAIMCIL